MHDLKKTSGSMGKICRISTAEATARTLREAILGGELLMGQVLSEVALCDMLGVSRTPLREAIAELEGQQLVEVIPYKGARVFKLTAAQVTDLGEFRKMLELGALKVALDSDPQRLADDLAEIVAEMGRLCASGQSEGFGKLDTKFHECIIAHSRNEYLIRAYRLVALKLAVLRMLIQRDDTAIGTSYESHVELLQYIRNSDSRTTGTLLERHIDGGTRFYEAKTEDALRLRVVGRS